MIIIRKAKHEDLDQLAGLFDGYRIFYRQVSDIAAAKKFLLERMENNDAAIFVAEQENELVGFTQLYPYFSSVGMQRTWVLNDIYVYEKARKFGVASKLLAAAREFGIETGSRWLLLQTSANNYTAQSVYEKNGWQKIDDYFYELPLVYK